MAVTTLTRIVNSTSGWIYIQNHEHPNTIGNFEVLPPNTGFSITLPIPWCTSQGDFDGGHFIEIGSWDINHNPINLRYIIWQQNRWFKDGDHIRYSRDRQWHDRDGFWVPGANSVDGNRVLVVTQFDVDPAGLLLQMS